MNYLVNLSERNKNVYNIVKESFKTKDSVAICQATGAGKSYIAMELIANNKDKSIYYIAPTLAILKQFKRNMASEGLLGKDIIDRVNDLTEEELDERIKLYFPNLKLKTYHWFHKHAGELDDEQIDYLICDEYHHTGGDKWYLSFNEFRAKHKETKYFGMTATPQRLDGQATIFSFDNDIVYTYSLAEAILDGVLPIPIYIDFGVRYLEQIVEAREIINEEYEEGNEKNKLLNDIDLFIRNINSYKDLPEVLAHYLPKNSKVLYFCPPSDGLDRINNTKKIYNIFNMREEMFQKVNENAHFYLSFGEYSQSEIEEEMFLKDEDDVLRVLYTVNKYNEGVHVENIDAEIIGRGTTSVALFYQIIGRVLAAGKNKNIRPIIIDLAGNINIYQEIVEEIRHEAKRRVERGQSLPNNVNIEQFMANFKIYDYELEQKEFLERINNNIRDNRVKRNNLLVLEVVKEIINYCEAFKEWPKHYNKPKNEKEVWSKRLALWLTKSNYNKEACEFKYPYIVDENGIGVKDILDELYSKYGRIPKYDIRYVIMMIFTIERYCIVADEWPKEFENPQTDLELDSKICKDWLNKIKYNPNDKKFRYFHVEDNEKLKAWLDRLYKKYYKVPGSDAYVLDRTREIKNYCEVYKEWPMRYNKPKNEKETISNKLHNWLTNSYFNIEGKEFKYINVVDENGISVKDILDDLYLKYRKISKSSEEYVINMVKQIASYCGTYEEWPRQFVKHKTEKEILSNKLYSWLKTGNYNKEDSEFKYTHVLYENGVGVKDILDDLYKKYSKLSMFSVEYVIEKVKQIKNYCETYKEWPAKFRNYKDEKEEISYKLYCWLYNSNYNKEDKEFKYINVVDENGVNVKDILDDLYKKYCKLSMFSVEYVIEKIKQIKNYCETYKEWPAKFRNYKDEKEEISYKLYCWLNNSYFNIEGREFKYINVVDENGVNVKDILDRYYAIYAKRGLNKVSNDLAILNIWQAKDSKNIGLSLYYLIVQLQNAMINNNIEMFNYYRDFINIKLKNNNLDLNIDELLDILNLDKETQIDIIYQKYMKYSIANNKELALLFKNLFNYSLTIRFKTLSRKLILD